MSAESLKKALAELHEQLGSVEHVDEEVRDLLTGAVDDIHRTLDDAGAGEPDEGSILDRLSRAAEHFEDSHPAVAATLGRLADMLSRMGI